MSGTIHHKGKQLDLEIRRGVDFALQITALDDTGTAVDLTGASIQAQIKTSPIDPAPLVTFTGVQGTAPATNQYTLSITANDTLALPENLDFSNPAKLFWDCVILWANGSIQPAYYGYVYVNPQVTA